MFNLEKPYKIGGALLIFIILFSFILNDQIIQFSYYLFFGFLIFILGLVDDIYVLKPMQKLFGELIIVIFLCIFYYYRLLNYGYLDLFFILIIYIIIINAANLIDGLDSLLGFISSSTLLIFSIVFNTNSFPLLIIALIICIITFFNTNPAKIYFGDSGALFIGYTIVFFCFELEGQFVKLLPFMLFPVPVLDFCFAILRRIVISKNIFTRDEGHIHHILFAKFKSVNKTVMLLVGIHTIIILINMYIFKIYILY